MYLSKASYQRFVATIYFMESMYALFFAAVGVDKLFHFTDISWESYLSAFLVQTAPVAGTVILTCIAVAQIAIGCMLLLPGVISRIGAYAAFILLVLLSLDLVLADGGEFFSRAALYALIAVGAFALVQMQQIYRDLHA